MAIPHKYRRNTDGTFAKGNAGRPKGAKNRTTLAAQQLLDGEAETITRKAVEVALNGDVAALRLCLDRIAAPKREREIELCIPRVETASDAVAAASDILQAVGAGQITPSEGAGLMSLALSPNLGPR